MLDFLLAHEELLLRFCEDAGIDPRQIHRLGVGTR